MKQNIALIALGALALVSCNRQDQTSEASPDNMVVPSSETNTMNAEVAPDGGVFANTAASSDAFEIAISKLALEKSKSAGIRKFSQEMIDAHSQSTVKLKAAAAKASPAIVPDPALPADLQVKLDKLKMLSGPEFDTAYASAQVGAHEATLAALKAYSAGGDVISLKSFADEITPIVSHHLEMAKAL